MKDGYNHVNRHKYYLKCHLIFCVKYRRKILVGKFNSDIKSVFQSISDNSDFEIDIMETDKDHIHFLLSYDATDRVCDIVKIVKQETTYYLWQKYNSVLSKQYWKKKIFWSDVYFACSIGEVSSATIQKYIESRG